MIDNGADDRPSPDHSGEPDVVDAGSSNPQTPSTGGLDSAGAERSADPEESVAPGSAADAEPSAPRRLGRRRGKKKKARRKAPWWELPALVVLAIGIAILVKSFVVQPFYIPSDSMEKTLHGCMGCHGDRILVNKPIYDLRDPHPGDIVVFNAPPGWDDEPGSTPPSNPILRTVRGFGQLIGFVPPDGEVLVKRVIAMGGQTVKGDAQGHVMISNNGPKGTFRTLNEPFVYAPAAERERLFKFGPVTVPKGRLWVMGDHRTDSADSRYHCTPAVGQGTTNETDCNPKSSTVPVDNVIGKAFVIAWPPSRWRTLGTPTTFESAASATGPALPAVASLSVFVPVFLLRRRGRRTDREDRSVAGRGSARPRRPVRRARR